MLDIKFIKENKDIVAEAAKNKRQNIDVDELLDAYEKRKTLLQTLEEVNKQRNEAAQKRDIEKGGELKKEFEKIEAEKAEADKKFLGLMMKVPNIPSPDTPISKDESGNQVLRSWGEKRNFSFKPKDHFELGQKLDLIDTETAATITGARFAYLKGGLVRLQFALIQLCMEKLCDLQTLEKIAKEANLKIKITPFTPILPPVMVKTAVQNRMARFLTPEEHYIFPNDDLMMVGSAEHTLGPIFMDQIIPEDKLPIRFVGYSSAFRREAGSYGKDTKGILRQHQFDKVEMESFTLPENSLAEQEFLVAIQEYFMKLLKLPYQVVLISTGDMGFPDYRQIDLETWMPGQDKYRETHSSDLTTSFQSRRLNTRVKRKDGKTEPVHMNDATVMAMGRIMIAIMENYQEEDGSIRVPEVLVKYIGKETL